MKKVVNLRVLQIFFVITGVIILFTVFIKIKSLASNEEIVNINANEEIDYSRYMRKVWFAENEAFDGEDYGYGRKFSIYFNEMADGKNIELNCVFSGFLIKPGVNFYSPENNSEVAYLSIKPKKNAGIASGHFEDSSGNKGYIKLNFNSVEDVIEAEIKFTSLSTYEQKQGKTLESLSGIFLLSPYNINDIENFDVFEEHIIKADINSWGDVKFISGLTTTGRHISTSAYLTDAEENILYVFSPIPNNIYFDSVSIEDLNNDGLKDFLMIFGDYILTFYQNQDGLFESGGVDIEIGETLSEDLTINTVKKYLMEKNKY